MAARTWPHRTLRTAPRQTRRSPLNPATRSAADRTGVRAPTPIRCVQSRCPLASPAACASPLPCAHCRNTRLWIAQFISYRYPDLHHRLLGNQRTYIIWVICLKVRRVALTQALGLLRWNAQILADFLRQVVVDFGVPRSEERRV